VESGEIPVDIGQEGNTHNPTIKDLAPQTQAIRRAAAAVCVFLSCVCPALAQTAGGSPVLSPEEAGRRLRTLGITEQEALQAAERAGIALPGDTLHAAPVPARSDSTLQPPASPAEPRFTPPAPGILHPRGAYGLPFFGYEIFGGGTGAFDPGESGPADPEYLIGMDDVLRVTVWGQVEFQHELAVDREGRVFIPTVGPFPIAGLTLREATARLTRSMARSYAGLVARPPTVWLDLTLARLRPKRVFIMGDVRNPGAYAVSSHATVFTSLFAVGGPAVTGSLREIRLLRGNTVTARVDLYDYLVPGEGTGDVRVQNNDVIVVPSRGRTVSIRGEVRRPGIYELRAGEHLADLLRFAGGILPTAYEGSAQIDRILPPEARSGNADDRRVIDVPLVQVIAGGGPGVRLEDGDDVQVFQVLDEKRNYVTIEGAVWRPGRYELTGLRSVRQLLEAARGVHPSAYHDLAHLARLNPDRMTRTLIAFDLRVLLEDSSADIGLEPLDNVKVYPRTITDISDPFVTIRGSVKNPGRYALSANMTLTDLIAIAGGYTENAELLRAEVSRVRPSGLMGDTLAIVLHPELPERPLSAPPPSGPAEFALQHRDEVLVRPNPWYITQANVRVAGDVRYPGTYSIRSRGELLSDILERAGGPTRTSSMIGAEFHRKGKRLILDFYEAYKERNPLHDVVMLDGDSLFIPSKPHTVLVTGEVNNPGLLSFIQGEDVTDYITRAGGLTDSASYAVLVQPTGESRRVDFGWFSNNPEVEEGGAIDVKKIPPPPPETAGTDVAGTIRDVFAILTSAATLAFIIWTVSE
jgi:protein involved in polysaccharide export with SLBB domain